MIKTNTNTLIKKYKEIHGELYDYSEVSFVNKYNKIKIICKKHGDFLQVKKLIEKFHALRTQPGIGAD